MKRKLSLILAVVMIASAVLALSAYAEFENTTFASEKLLTCYKSYYGNSQVVSVKYQQGVTDMNSFNGADAPWLPAELWEADMDSSNAVLMMCFYGGSYGENGLKMSGLYLSVPSSAPVLYSTDDAMAKLEVYSSDDLTTWTRVPVESAEYTGLDEQNSVDWLVLWFPKLVTAKFFAVRTTNAGSPSQSCLKTTGSLNNGCSYVGGFYDFTKSHISEDETTAKATDAMTDEKKQDEVTTESAKQPEKSNTGLIIAIIAAVVIIAAIIVVLILSKKKT